MPDTIIFDTLSYAKKPKAVGFTEKQAEVQTEILAQITPSQRRHLSFLKKILMSFSATFSCTDR